MATSKTTSLKFLLLHQQALTLIRQRPNNKDSLIRLSNKGLAERKEDDVREQTINKENVSGTKYKLKEINLVVKPLISLIYNIVQLFVAIGDQM